MNKLFTIIKTNLLNSWNIRKLKKLNIFKKILYAFLFIYVLGSVFASLGFYLYSFFNTLESLNMADKFIPLNLTLAIGCAFIFNIYNAKATLFESKDNDLLLSLPIKNHTILLSRIFTLALYNLLFIIVLTLPGIAIYVAKVDVGVTFYITMIITLLFSATIPTILSSIIGYIIAWLVAKTNFRNIFELSYYILFMALYFYIFTNANKFLSLITTDSKILTTIIKYLFSPIYFTNLAINTNNLIYMLYYVLVNIATIVIFVLIFKHIYFKIIFNLSSHKTNKEYKLKNITKLSVKKALLKKELNRYITSPIYIFNTAFGVVMLLIGAILSLVYSTDTLYKYLELGNIAPFLMVLMMTSFVVAVSNTSCISISMENNNLWILKSSPIKVKNIFKAKANLNELIVLPITYIALIIFKISFSLSFIELITLTVFLTILSFVTSNLGLIINLLLPKFNANSDVEIVKRSMSALAGILIPMILVFLGMFAFSKIHIDYILLLIITTIILGIILIILKRILNNWGEKRFKEIN